MRRLQKYFVVYLVSISTFVHYQAFSQCGTGVENISIQNYCNNQYATWTITNPQTGSSYRWNAASSYDVTNPGSTGTDYGYGTTFNSPVRLTHPTGTATGQVQYYYVKETPNTIVPLPSGFGSPGGDGTPFRMTFTTSSVLRMNSIDVPVLAYNDNVKKMQVRIQGPGGLDLYSPIQNYTRGASTSLGSTDRVLVRVSLNLTLTTTGVYTITGIGSPAGGTGENSDPFLWTSAPSGVFAGATGTGIRIQGGTLNPIYSGTNSSVLYNWNYTSFCGPNPSGFAFPTTTGCCTPIFFTPTMGSAENVIQSGVDAFTISATNFTECTGTGCYIQWFRNGASIPGAGGLNRTRFVATTAGAYTARLVLNSSYVSNNTIINNLSCYAEGVWNMEERAIFASASAPGFAPYCLGTTFRLNSTVDGFNVSWSPSSGVANPSAESTTYTAANTGSVEFTVSANIMSNNRIINGDFESGVIGPAGSTLLSLQADPGNVDNSYTIRTSVPAQEISGTNSFWRPCNGDGRFFIGNGFSGPTNPVVYSQLVSGLTPGQTYNLSYDITNISRNKAWNDVPPFGAAPDARFLVYINSSSVGGIVNTGAAGDVNKLCVWTTNTVNWTAPAGVTSANIEIRQVQLFSGGGLDFGLDNIRFGGLISQNAKVTVGPVIDCSTIVAFAGSCVGTNFTLTASVTGGMVFSRWERPVGTVVGTNAVLNVTSATGGVYTAYGLLPLNNVLENGDFESGNTGFLNGYPTYFAYQANFGSGGNNAYTVTSNTQAGNGSWVTLTPPVSGTGSNIYVADIKAPGGGKTGNKIVGWTFNATAGQSFLFNGYVANLHKDINQTSFPVFSANIGIEIGTNTVTSLALASNNGWNFLSGIWTAPSSGTFTLNVADYSSPTAQAGFGNDIALDNFSLRPLFGTFKTATVTGPVCVLPIDLLEFTATKKLDGVHLQWIATGGYAQDGFFVLRSADGVHFERIGFVDGKKGATGSTSFAFVDSKPNKGINYYRLVQINKDGKEDYSEIISISLDVADIQIFPNPSTGQLNILGLSGFSDVDVKITNTLGQTVYTKTWTKPTEVAIDLTSISHGIYLIQLGSDGIQSYYKWVKE